MMKNLIIATCAVLVITALNACSQQEIPDTPAPTAGTITVTARTAEEQTGTKTTLSGLETHWVKDVDKIGVFSPQAAGQKNNVLYTAQSNGKTSDFTGSLVWGAGAHDFYAYYPYNSTYNGDHEAVPFSLPSEQTQSAANNTDHIGALDYMVARHEGVTPPGPVSFNFKHLFAMIEFKITGTGTLKKIRLTGTDPLAHDNGIIRFSSGGGQDISGFSSSNYVTVTLTTPAALSGSPISVFMMVMPGNHSKNLQIALNFTDNTWKEISKAPPTDGWFYEGKKYVVTLDTESAGWAHEFKDLRDDQIYPYVTIGTQTWMAKNLAYLPEVYPFDDYGGYYVYGYNGTDVATAKTTANYQTYGVLYNWDVAMAGAASSDNNPSGVQGICPDGWHLPSDAEWKQLEMQLGMSPEDANKEGGRGTDEGGQLKENGTTHWTTPNTGATNSSGFTALPGGLLQYGNNFILIEDGGYWWTSTKKTDSDIYVRSMGYNKSIVYRSGQDPDFGFSVRCVRD